MTCSRCGKGEAIPSEEYGLLPCQDCQDKEIRLKRGPEFTTNSIRNQRREYKKDILQPWHDGVLSKEYVETYGTQGVKATKKDIKNARYRYKGLPGWWNRDKSKGGR